MTEYRWEGRTADEWRQVLNVPAVYLYDVIDSTNNAALTLAEAGAPSLTLVVADFQTSGRGRAGRSWFAQPGKSLLFSVVFRTHVGEQHVGTAPIRIGNIVAQAIEQLTAQRVMIKWPNDVVIPDSGKIAGILCEGVVRQHGHAYIVAGIGINVSAADDGFASLARVGTAPRRGELLRAIVARLTAVQERIIDPLTAAEQEHLRSRDLLFGEQVENEEGVRGRGCGIARDGSLLVETQRGLQAVQSATIRLAESGAYPGSRT